MWRRVSDWQRSALYRVAPRGIDTIAFFRQRHEMRASVQGLVTA